MVGSLGGCEPEAVEQKDYIVVAEDTRGWPFVVAKEGVVVATIAVAWPSNVVVAAGSSVETLQRGEEVNTGLRNEQKKLTLRGNLRHGTSERRRLID